MKMPNVVLASFRMLAVAALACCAGRAQAATFTVSTTAASGAGSLLTAINGANATSVGTNNTIAFNIPAGQAVGGVFTIRPTGGLPTLIRSTVIDGSTQTTFGGNINSSGPEVVINGSLAGAANGLAFGSSGSGAVGVTVNGFTGDGIVVSGSGVIGVWIRGCYVGTNPLGTGATPNGGDGVVFTGSATGIIGGSVVAERNVISGNTGNGIRLDTGSSNGVILGNYIGLNAAGTGNVHNGNHGIFILNSSTNNQIGSIVAGNGNRIGYNQGDGIRIGASVGDASIGNVVRGNAIFLNGGLGINLQSVAASVTPNDATDSDTGPNNLQNFPTNLAITTNATSTTITGSLKSTPSTQFAIDIYRSGQAENTGFGEGETYMRSVNITTNASGDATFTNTITALYPGQYFSATATKLTTGDTSEFSAGLRVPTTALVTNTNDSGAGSLRAAILFANANPGTNITFNIPNTDPNFSGGVFTIRPLTSLPSLTADSIRIDGATQTSFTGNTNASGPEVVINGASQASGGGLTLAATNAKLQNLVINGAKSHGVIVLTPGTGNLIQNCYIGTNAAGTAGVPNSGNGIAVSGSAQNVLIGGPAVNISPAPLGNIIAFNTLNGVSVQSAAKTITIRGNSIFSNTRLGIDLVGGVETGGVTANDTTDADLGPNNLQNFPVLTAVNAAATSSTIIGTLNSVANTSFFIDFYKSTATAGSGEGQTYVGSTVVATNGAGDASFSFPVAQNLEGLFIGATATHVVTKDTSEFSASRLGTASVAIVTNISDTGAGSLRNAITFANANTGTIIRFNIPAAQLAGGVFTIVPATPLPVVTGNNTLVDGASQTVFTGNTNVSGPEIVINGANAGPGGDGLKLIGTNINVNGLVINGFNGNGMAIIGATSSSNRIQGCYIGTNASGSAAVPNGGDGVLIVDGAFANLVGGTTATLRNVISGNLGTAVLITGANTRGNTVAGNYIGLNATGTAALENSQGVLIGAGGSQNAIGGTSSGAGNVIAGNAGVAVQIDGGGGTTTKSNTITGNRIGTNALGTAAVPNDGTGILLVAGANTNTIGGTTVAARNIISGNAGTGVLITGATSNSNLVQGNYIGTNLAGTGALPNTTGGVLVTGGATSNTVGGTASGAGNVISGNTGSGVQFSGANSNTLQGNLIGVRADGTVALGNSSLGLLLINASSSVVGGPSAAARNVIAGNTQAGIQIDGGGSATATQNNVVQGNYIGTNAAGTAAIANGAQGIIMVGRASNNSIGGTITGAGNVISGNISNGILIANALTSNNTVQGNLIGTNAAGTGAVPNVAIGVSIVNGASSNIIGGNTAAARNVISGNGSSGLQLADASTASNSVLGNYIGVNAAGTAALANQGQGVLVVSGASTNQIGAGSGGGNVISGNTGIGVLVDGATTSGNIIAGNRIGTNAAGAAGVANGSHGVLVSGSPLTTVGGTGTGAGNTIAFNTGTGVLVTGTVTGASIRANSIFSNSTLGINLTGGTENVNGVTLNDANDVDTGPNNAQNFPVITSAASSGGSTAIAGTFNSTASTDFTLDFFRSTAADSSGFGEGQVYLGSVNVTTNASGNATFNFNATGNFGGQFVTSTATSTSGAGLGSTSEFSQVFTATGTAGAIARSGGLSTAKANAAAGTVSLTFASALDAESVADVSHYGVQVNGAAVEVIGAASNGSNGVTLTLAEGAVQAGDEVTVSWNGLQGAGGNALSGATGVVIAR